MMNVRLDTPRFLLSDLDKVVEAPMNTLQGWINRSSISLSEYDREAGGQGNRRLLTLRTIYGFALTNHLVAHGFAPSRAFANLKSFLQLEFQRLGYCSIVPHKDDARNESTLLFDKGSTLLFIYREPDQPTAGTHHETFGAYTFVVQIDKATDLRQVIFGRGGDKVSVSTAVKCNAILGAVDRGLGVL
jgi:hypothetical protein